ncbi:MAG: hypothetical protein Q9180_005224 [Flavoplaca navasiana]
MKHIKSNPDGGSGKHHSSYHLFREAVDSGCLICKHFERRNELQQPSADVSKTRLTLSYNYDSEIRGGFDNPRLPDGTVQLCLVVDKLELSSIVDGREISLETENLFLALVPVQPEEDTASLGRNDDKSLEQTSDGVPKSLEASTTGSPECLAPGMFWLQKCIQQHSTCDRPALVSAEEMRPSRLIDIGTFKEDCLRLCLQADFPADLQYATLSHCWGVFQGRVHLTQRCLEAWQTVIPKEALMPTFKDAIKVTQSLGMRYLWIDSLCIIQDSKSDWHYESSRMSNVYKYAHCNIAATASEGDASGMFTNREPRIDLPVLLDFANITCDFTESESGTCLKGVYSLHRNYMWFYEMEVDAPLTTRAWVVQEVCMNSLMTKLQLRLLAAALSAPGSPFCKYADLLGMQRAPSMRVVAKRHAARAVYQR